MKTLIIDWKHKKSYGVRTYIKKYMVHGSEELHYVNFNRMLVENVTFLNFPQIHIEHNQMFQCRFENCGEVYLSTDCGHGNCIFYNIKFLYSSGRFLKYCEFENIRCSGATLVEMNACRMSGCTFKNIELLNNNFLVCGHGSSYISHCKTDNVATARKDGKLFCRDEWHFLPFVDEETQMNISEVRQNKHI